jgi:GTPase SAR1 family protein
VPNVCRTSQRTQDPHLKKQKMEKYSSEPSAPLAPWLPPRQTAPTLRDTQLGNSVIDIKEMKKYSDIITGLTDLYKKKLLPLELHSCYEQFGSFPLSDAELASKPQVLILGQYSVGKTTFIENLLETPYADSQIGPEPTTDRFISIMTSPTQRVIPGNAACVSKDLPFQGLTQFGSAFLQRFQVSAMPNPVLDGVTIIDTPGILSGEKQRVDRGYDFTKVVAWFAARADLILLLFDAHKLDISDEFRDAIHSLVGNEEKVKVVLNKADAVETASLMRVFGALNWSLSKVWKSPEVLRIFVGSFWNRPYQHTEMSGLFDGEKRELYNLFRELPRNATVRKINELVKRARAVKVHALIVAHLKKQMPALFGKDSKRKELLAGLEKEYQVVARKYGLTLSDFPPVGQMQSKLADYDFDKFNKKSNDLLIKVDQLLKEDLPRLMLAFPPSQIVPIEQQNPFVSDFLPVTRTQGPPGYQWIWDYIPEKANYLNLFTTLSPNNTPLSGQQVKSILESSGLDSTSLSKIWGLADWTRDGYLDRWEFVVANALVRIVREGGVLPDILPETMKPPGTLR